MRAGIVLAIVLSGTSVHASTRTPYGGEVVAQVFGPPIALSPARARTSADVTVHRALYERLYRIDTAGRLVSELASGPPVIRGRTIVVSLRADVLLHDGRTLTTEMVAESLRRLVVDRTMGAYVGAHVRGALDHFAGKNPPLGIRARGTDVVFELAVDHDDYPRVLAAKHAAIMVPAADRAGALGSGPFRFHTRGARGAVTLLPFLNHRAGRPFLDRLVFKPNASRFGAASAARSARTFVFGVPDTKSETPRPSSWAESAVEPPHETLVLAVGPGLRSAERRIVLLAAIDRALNRRRLVSRFLGSDAVPTRRLLGLEDTVTMAGERPDPSSFAMLVARDGREGHRFAERVQLDLLRVGITVRIERVSTERLVARRLAGDFDLLLDSVRSATVRSDNPADALHGLLSIAAEMGRPGAVRLQDLATFKGAKRERRAAVEQIEVRVRRSLGLVPIARRQAGIVVDPKLQKVELEPDGAVGLANAYRER